MVKMYALFLYTFMELKTIASRQGAIHFSVRGFGRALFVFREVHTVDKIIEALYFSNISPLNKAPSAKEQALLGFLERHKAALDQRLDPEEKVWLEKYTSCHEELMTEREIRVFTLGFKLGMCFTIEGTDLPTE